MVIIRPKKKQISNNMTQEDKKVITDELDRRLMQLWDASSSQDDHDAYYRNPLVRQLKELAVFVYNIKEENES